MNCKSFFTFILCVGIPQQVGSNGVSMCASTVEMIQLHCVKIWRILVQ